MQKVVCGASWYNMPKIAVLIAGEYRKLDVTRNTMPFLDDSNVDVYVSTWDKTVYQNKRIKFHVAETITEERINNDLRLNVTVLIDDHNLIKNKKYNSKMINRWQAGLNLIEKSNVDYDYIIVTRSDLFYEIPFDLSDIEKYKDSIGCSWSTSMHLGKLADILFVSSYENIRTLISSLSIDDWNKSKKHDWHIWWYNHVNEKFNILDTPDYGRCIFCRYWVNKTHTFTDVVNIQEDWRDMTLLTQMDLLGETFFKENNIWPDRVIIEAKEKWSSGYFNKYMYESSNI
jgi:hypothetical protein